MFLRLGRFVYRARWVVVGVWAALLAVAIIFAMQASHVLKGGGFDAPSAEYFIADQKIRQNLGGFPSEVIVLFAAPPGVRADDPVFARQVDEAMAGARNFKDTRAVITFFNTQEPSFISKDGRYTYAIIGLNTDTDQTQENLEEIRQTLKPGNLKMTLTGAAVYNEAITKVSEEDALRGELIAFPLALVVLLVVFRTVVAALLPLIMAGSAILLTMGTLFFVGQGVDLSVFVLNIATLLGLGLSIDYSLLIVSRFREELHRTDHDLEESVSITLNTAGRAVFFSGLTVMIGLGSLFIFDLMVMRSIGAGGIMVVMAGLLASLTLLPAILSILGRRVNSLKLPFIKSIETVLKEGKKSFWRRVAEGVMKQPLLVLVVVVAFLLLLGSPIQHIRFGTSSYEILPASSPTRQAIETVVNDFPNATKNSDVTLVVEAKNGKMTDPANVAALFDYTRKLASDPLVRNVLSPVNLPSPIPFTKEVYQQLLGNYAANPNGLDPRLRGALQTMINGNIAMVKLDTGIKYTSDEATAYIKNLRANQPPEFKVLVTGEQARLEDFVSAVYGRFPVAIGLVVILTYLVLLMMFGSVVVPIQAVFTTGVSLAASYGALVWIFQDGNLTDLLGFTAPGYVEAVLPVLLFALLFGLSMDYEVFLLTRVYEIYQEDNDEILSVAEGVGRTAGIITSAALIMIMVASGFALAAILAVKAIGVGMAIAVAVDATIVRGLLVPATMKLLGHYNWWSPPFLRRYLPRLKVE